MKEIKARHAISKDISDDYALGTHNVLFYFALFRFFNSKEDSKILINLAKTVQKSM